MNTSPVPSRLFCRMVRHWSGAQSSHVARCAACQEHFAVAGALEAALRRDARQSGFEPKGDMTRRIMRAVQESAAARRPAPARGRGGMWVLGGALAALAFSVVIFQHGVSEKPAQVSRADAEAIVATVNALSDQLVDTVIPTAGAIVADNPMQRELDSIYSDARSALGFLALNFLPATPTPAEKSRSG